MVWAQVMAEVFALQRIQADVMFRNDDYVAAEKVKAINRLLEHLRLQMRALVRDSRPTASASPATVATQLLACLKSNIGSEGQTPCLCAHILRSQLCLLTWVMQCLQRATASLGRSAETWPIAHGRP